nr:DUF4142 domain-containing protein [uncultured Flavobacterium sp.]
MKSTVYISKIVFGTGLLLLTMNSCKNEPKHEDPIQSSEKENETKFEKKDIADDSGFLTQAAELNIMEAEIGKLGYQKGIDEDVKKYAKMLIEDHSKSLEELKILASENTITMAASMSEAGTEKYNQLKELSGDDFDRKFVGMVLEEHEKGVGIMTAISQNATNEDFKLWASRQTSVFVKHYEEAKMLKEKFGELNN